MVLVGASSKHDKDGSENDMAPTCRWGLAGGLAITFAEAGFHIVLTARRSAVLEEMAEEVRKVQLANGLPTKTFCVSCDLTKDADVASAFDAITKEFDGTGSFVDCLIFNASPAFPPGFSFGEGAPKPHELDPQYMLDAYDVSVPGLIRCLKHIMPGMLDRKQGCLLLSGATMQIRGGANFSALAPGKTALRSFGQSAYQAYGPKGIHVCNINIDGVIDSPNTRKWMPTEKLMKCDELAAQYLAVYNQGRSVWSYELQLTPDHSSNSVGMRM